VFCVCTSEESAILLMQPCSCLIRVPYPMASASSKIRMTRLLCGKCHTRILGHCEAAALTGEQEELAGLMILLGRPQACVSVRTRLAGRLATVAGSWSASDSSQLDHQFMVSSVRSSPGQDTKEQDEI